jgi:hypothetical protein
MLLRPLPLKAEARSDDELWPNANQFDVKTSPLPGSAMTHPPTMISDAIVTLLSRPSNWERVSSTCLAAAVIPINR